MPNISSSIHHPPYGSSAAPESFEIQGSQNLAQQSIAQRLSHIAARRADQCLERSARALSKACCCISILGIIGIPAVIIATLSIAFGKQYPEQERCYSSNDCQIGGFRRLLLEEAKKCRGYAPCDVEKRMAIATFTVLGMFVAGYPLAVLFGCCSRPTR